MTQPEWEDEGRAGQGRAEQGGVRGGRGRGGRERARTVYNDDAHMHRHENR